MKMLQIDSTTFINPEIIALVEVVVSTDRHPLNILTKNGKSYRIEVPALITAAYEQLGLF